MDHLPKQLLGGIMAMHSMKKNQDLTNTSHDLPAGGRLYFMSKVAKLEFPKYLSTDPMEWLSCVEQFFEYQGTQEAQKIALALFH